MDHHPRLQSLRPRFKQNAIGGADGAQVVKRLATLAGFIPETLATHALRRGFATSAIK